MKRNSVSLSRASSYRETAEYWDDHDLSRVWSKTSPARFDVEIESEATYFAIDSSLLERLRVLARKRGVSSGTLINLWLQEKLREKLPR
ncbi:MAG: CopG family antitoxin [Candidatus Eisenbacteria bacterium]|nr:CopG family antitoxin [Candidatus Eisenbacteria bacterium]